MKAHIKKFAQIPLIKLLVFSMISVTFLELFIRGDLFKTTNWFWTHPNMFAVNVLALLGIILLIHGLINRWRATAITVMVLCWLYGMVNSVKFKTLGQYYYPWDNGSITQLSGISKNLMNLDFSKPLLFLALGTALIFWLLKRKYYRGHDLKLNGFARIGAMSLAVLAIGALVYHKEWKLDPAMNAIGVRNYAWAPVHSYVNNGSVVAYFINYRMNYVEKPQNYSKEEIAAIVTEISAAYEAQTADAGGNGGIRPNIIVVQSEALWDPNQLTDVRFSQDPMVHLNKARKSNFVSPTFGGYTSNVEFEFLTGMTMKFLPPTSVPYQHFIKKSMPSLPSELKRNGYATSAIHPYIPEFWGRNKVYPLLGFDEFITQDDFKGAKKKGYYYSDDSVMDKIIGKIETTEEPLFVFAVTMQNHGPFKDNRYKGTEIQAVTADPAVKEQMLDTYAQGVLDADLAFKKLTDYVAASGEPTLVIQFGDHLPSLGDNFEMYQKYGYIRKGISTYQDMTAEEQLKIRCTQVSAFSNYKDIELPAYVSPSMLSVRLLAYTGSEMSDYYQMLYGMSDTFTCIYGQNVIDNNGVIAPMDDKTAREYWQLEYDLLVGKQYFKEIEAAKDMENAPLVGLKQ